MNKKEYLARLETLLACLPKDSRAESVAFYAEMIDDRMEDGMTEEQAVEALGSPGAAADAILDDLPAVPRAVVKTRRKSTVLMWTLIILGSVVWVPLLIAFIMVAVSVYACIWILIACLWLVSVGLVAAMPAGIIVAIWGGIAGNLPFALAESGAGLLCAGLGLAMVYVSIAATKQLARLSKIWARKMMSPFFKKRNALNAEGTGAPNAAQAA